MPVSFASFDSFVAQSEATVTDLMQELGSWANNKNNLDPKQVYDYGGPQNIIAAAVAAFETAVQSVVAL